MTRSDIDWEYKWRTMRDIAKQYFESLQLARAQLHETRLGHRVSIVPPYFCYDCTWRERPLTAELFKDPE